VSDTPVWNDTLRTFGDAIGAHPRTVRRMVDCGDVRAVRFGSVKKPILRLEPPAEFVAREGRFSGPDPSPTDQT